MMINRKIGFALVVAVISIFVTGIYYFYSWFYLWSPRPEWDKSPRNEVISIGEVLTEVDYNYIPAVRIWGDGYIVWVKYAWDGSRKVFEGYLSQQEMTLLVQRFIEQGFFKRYRESKDYAGVYISVHLVEAHHSEWLDPENKQLYELANYLKTGAGVLGKELIPTVGTFFALPIEKSWLPANTKANYFWPDDKFGYGLDNIASQSDGKEITGDELKFAWQVVNSPLAVVESNGRVYWIAVMLPKVSH